jgi:hypothetical protein
MTHNKDINWEERRFYAATHIFSGICANYHQGLTPSTFYIKYSIILADHLLHHLSTSKGTICPDLYQRESKEQ